ncbi:signal peptide peptidase-like 2B, partial [Dinothrombium tinctorium]
ANNESSRIVDNHSETNRARLARNEPKSESKNVNGEIAVDKNTRMIAPAFGVLVVRNETVANNSFEERFCILHFSDGYLPKTMREAHFVRLLNKTSQTISEDFCTRSTGKQLTQPTVVLINYSSKCEVAQQVENVAKSYINSTGVLIVVQQSFNFKKVKIPFNLTGDLNFLIAFISTHSANKIYSTPGDKVILAFSDSSLLFFDYSLVIIWFMAVFTLCVGSYWSGVVRASLFRQKQRETQSIIKKSQRSQQASKQKEGEEEQYLNVSPVWVFVFVVFMAAMLLALYYFFDYLVYVIIVLFVLASVMSLCACIDIILQKFLPSTWLTSNAKLCFSNSKLPIYQLFVLPFALGLPLIWFFIRKEESSWILQDFLGIIFSINMLRTIRLPSFKICFILLSLLFFYDIFFVFITPLITSKGESVMVEVATGGGKYDSGGGDGGKVSEQLPMVLRVPHLNSLNESDPLLVCSRGGKSFSLLGFGDILVPGLLVSFCCAFDIIYGVSFHLYYVTTSICYGLGLIATFLGLYFMNGVPQPALLYLVPFTVIPIIVIGLLRKEMKKLWNGPGDGTIKDKSEKISQNAATNDENLLIDSSPQHSEELQSTSNQNSRSLPSPQT